MFFDGIAFAMGSLSQGSQGGGNPIFSFLPLIAMFIIFYLLLIRPQQKKTKQHKEMLTELSKGDWVVTGGGLIGRIVDIDGDTLSVDIGSQEEVVVAVHRNFVGSKTDQTKEFRKRKKS
ncbi:preprotein translocase subunit YajC [Desulfovibrionales bacterium]